LPKNLQTDLNNELNLDRFKLTFREIPNITINCQAAPVPGVSGHPLEMPNSLNKLFVPGRKMDYENLTVTFKVDENLKTWKELYAWMLGIYSPQEFEQFVEFQKHLEIAPFINQYKYGFDATVHSLTNAMNPNIEFTYVHLFPISLSAIDFNFTNSEMSTAQATFQYDYFMIR
jgi:hypothetical protein